MEELNVNAGADADRTAAAALGIGDAEACSISENEHLAVSPLCRPKSDSGKLSRGWCQNGNRGFPSKRGALTKHALANTAAFHMPATILIVEDDQPTLGGLASLFENAGYTVITANTYVAGREALQTRDPDLLLVDIRLGAFNGLQIVAARPRPIPSIVLTGHADVVLELEARRFGAEYLVKPVAPSVLLALVRAKLENPSVARTQRRWPRKQLVAFVPVWVNQWSGRLIDISYGGARFEVDDRFASLSGKVHISVPSRNVTVSAHVVWAAQSEAGCVVGTELLYDSQQADAWRNLVNHSLSR